VPGPIEVEKSKVSALIVRLFSIWLYQFLFDVCSKQPRPRLQVSNPTTGFYLGLVPSVHQKTKCDVEWSNSN